MCNVETTINTDGTAKHTLNAKYQEGWQAERALTSRVYHYIVDTFSLCGRLGFYVGELMPHTGNKGKEDCAECFRKAEKRYNKANKRGTQWQFVRLATRKC